ncbi:MAG TPA: hypothetical protein VFV19_08890 [Candidatus Polarisedimenticolaceae bacterium]|nr:hypothetical protein [Candidatus Polarisedimenticolaceae bacterium]
MVKVRASVLAVAALASACGGPSNPVTGNGGRTTLLEVQTQVLTPRCALSGCHVGTGAPFGLDMSSVSASAAHLVNVDSGENASMKRVLPGDSANSYMYWKITGNPAIGGQQMPLSGGPLSQAQIDLVASWIDEGAK